MSSLGKFTFASVVVLLAACTQFKDVATDDYGQFLSKNTGTHQFDRLNVATQYYMTPGTREHHFEFVSNAGGAPPTTWVVEFGKILAATMQSVDVTSALGTLTPVSENEVDQGSTIIFDLRSYGYDHYRAHVGLMISIKRNGNQIFKKGYFVDGVPQTRSTLLKGASEVKNAVQRSTKSAMDKILASFIDDARDL